MLRIRVPFKKGQKKIAGRTKGTPNKKTLTLFEELDQILTEDGEPVSIVKMLMAGIHAQPAFQQVDSLLKLMEFVFPKRKHTEHDLSDDEFKRMLIKKLTKDDA